MFKRYRMEYFPSDGSKTKTSVDFFIHIKRTRNGFSRRACVIGAIPRLDDTSNDWCKYRENSAKLEKSRVNKVGYCDSTWEAYPGQTCLSGLWEKLNKLDFVDMSAICVENPFASDSEPSGKDMIEPDVLFDSLRWGDA